MKVNSINKKKNFKSLLKAVIGTLFIGGLGSGVWEYILKPIFIRFYSLILNIFTLGFTSLKNDIYIEVSKGFHSDEALTLLILFYGIVLYISILLIFIAFRLFKLIKENKTIDDLYEEKDINNSGDFFSKRKFSWFTILSIIIISSSMAINTISSFKVMYINGTITYYTQLKTICIPYISSYENQIFESRFSQIQNEQDYFDIINDLQELANKNNLIFNEFSPF